MPLAGIVSLILESKRASDLAATALWNAVQLTPEKIPENKHADLACVAACLGAICRQYDSFLETIGGRE